tara:strand:- start:6964 stop:7893 length:930 start_codon:yes stop_codon:yes gene_type:complete
MLVPQFAVAQNLEIKNFAKAKRLALKLWRVEETFYCGCEYGEPFKEDWNMIDRIQDATKISMIFEQMIEAYVQGDDERLQKLWEFMKYQRVTGGGIIMHPSGLFDSLIGKDKKAVNLKACGLKGHKMNSRALRIEWEHLLPASAYGKTFPSWTKGDPECYTRKGVLFSKKRYKGRRCTSKVSQTFRYMEADLYNLVPAVGWVNGLRSNLPMSMIEGEERNYGTCDIEFDFQNRKFEPTDVIRGWIARAHLYMAKSYPQHVHFPDNQLVMFILWNRDDPPSGHEQHWARGVKRIQGNENTFITDWKKDDE